MTLFDVTEFGAAGNGEVNDTAACQNAADACREIGGGTLFFPADRTFLIDKLIIYSNTKVELAGGSRIAANPAAGGGVFDSVIEAADASNIRISGTGSIDGNGLRYMDTGHPHLYRAVRSRPKLLAFRRCRNIRLHDISVRNSAFWALTAAGCSDVVISGVTVLNSLKAPNTDGIDIDNSSFVRISDCYIESGDDCICIKTTGHEPGAGPSENITVTGCVMRSSSCAFKLGSESTDDIRNVAVHGCIITGSNRGIGLQLRDQGSMENIMFSDMIVTTELKYPGWWGRAEPVYVTAFPRKEGGRTGKIRNITFMNINCNAENGFYLAGMPDNHLKDINIKDVRLHLEKRTEYPGGCYDRRPGAGQEVVTHQTAGLHAEYIEGLNLKDFTVTRGDDIPEYFGPDVYRHSVR
ncbi:MAG: glycoside hydrolase family 28 protein [Spirochaetia bacterium]